MPEELQTRGEHSRSMEDAETLRAIETLKDLGLLIPFSEVETYHGRSSGSDEEPFEVRPDFNNSGNSTGNSNINQRQSLYTGGEDVALEFAKARAGEGQIAGRRAEVHKIISTDSDAVLLDPYFDPNTLSDEDRQKFFEALGALTLRATEGSPLAFDERDSVPRLAEAIKELGKSYICIDDIPGLADSAGVSEEVAIRAAGALNVRSYIKSYPGWLASSYMSHPEEVYFDMKRNGIILNFEYLEEFFRKAHIVGIVQKPYSATLGKRIEAFSLIGLDRVNTESAIQSEREESWDNMGEMSRTFNNLPLTSESDRAPLIQRLEDLHAKPRTLVEEAKMVEGYADIFEADAGNWEGYTLEEHTETVLRLFDENFADKLPVDLLTPMRLIILAHDIGKPVAAASGEKYKQKEYNVRQAEDFLTKLGVSKNYIDLIKAIIGEGASLAGDINVKKAGEPAKKALRDLAIRSIQELTGQDKVLDSQIKGFEEMCYILQICDGAAYTSMATTVRPVEQGGTFRNAPSFNETYSTPVAFGSRDIRLRKDGDTAASRDLTPRVDMEDYRKKLEEIRAIKAQSTGEAA